VIAVAVPNDVTAVLPPPSGLLLLLLGVELELQPSTAMTSTVTVAGTKRTIGRQNNLNDIEGPPFSRGGSRNRCVQEPFSLHCVKDDDNENRKELVHCPFCSLLCDWDVSATMSGRLFNQNGDDRRSSKCLDRKPGSGSSSV
jgi:hypothetical protein